MPTNDNNERFDWGPYSRGGDSGGWAEDTEAEDGKSGLAELLDTAEQQMTIKDAESAIQNYRPLAGRTFEATDSEREYVGDGTAWNQRATRGANPTLESATVEGPVHSQELSVSDVLDAPSYPTQSDLPADRSTGFIALIEDQNRIYFEGA
jgi:hypothetical protein